MQWRYYVADTLSALTTRVFRWSGAGDSFEIPLFSEVYGKMAQPKQKMSAQEIKDYVVKRLTE